MAMQDLAAAYLALTNQDPYVQSVARPGQTIVKRIPFQYGVLISNITLAGGAVTAPMTTLADSDFVFQTLSAGAQPTATTAVFYDRNLLLQIQDTSNGKFYFSQPSLMALVTGGGGFPFVFPAPRVIRPNSTLLFTATNRDVSTDYFAMYLTLGGTRIFYANN